MSIITPGKNTPELDFKTAEELTAKLGDRAWRLNNLYFIVDKHGQKVRFRLNPYAQSRLLNEMWYLNIVLKARQLGITTFICIFFLDAILFSKNKHAAIIAHTLEDAEQIFWRIRFAWDNLPDWLKAQFGADAENTRELRFNNGSSIRVATSVRSGTLQYLHISEFGRICQKYPDKAEEIVTGSLNTVQAGEIIFIESTAKGREGYFHDFCQVAMKNKRIGVDLTPLDYRFFFFPWYEAPEYQLPGYVHIPNDLRTYFRELEHKHGIKLNQAQMNWYAKKYETQEEEMLSEYPSTPEEAFRASVEGSYYGKLIEHAYADKRITSVPWEPKIPVDTWWDLGMNDHNSIIFTQDVGRELHVIDFYENEGEGLAHYAKILQAKPYVYGRHHLPHDVEVRELGTGKSRKESALSLGIKPLDVVKKLDIADGIEAARLMFPKCWFDEGRTEKLLKALTNYRKEWDDKLGAFKDKPLHDWSSNAADAFRYLAVGHRDMGEMQKFRVEEAPLDPFNPFAEMV